jgi:hypothetical protein
MVTTCIWQSKILDPVNILAREIIINTWWTQYTQSLTTKYISTSYSWRPVEDIDRFPKEIVKLHTIS